MEGLEMKTRFLETPPTGRRLARSSRARALVLCVLASFPSIPAFADSATFYVAASATVTLPGISNISYSVIVNQAGMSTFETGNAGLVFNNESFAFSNGTLTYGYGPASGWVHSSLVSSSLFNANQFTDLQITNTNNYSVELPITASLNFDGSVTAVGAVYSTSLAYLDLIYQTILGSPASFYVGAVCNQEPSNCSPFLFQGDIEPPTMSPVTVTSSLLIPANTALVLDVESGAIGNAVGEYANLPTPEPGTLTLLGTGLFGFVGVVRRRR
jgi:hypothetical protein